MQILKDEIKNKIIAAAVKEFSVLGYEKASMRSIARSAGTSVSNTYNYYQNKEELFDSIVGPVYRQVKHLLNQSLGQSSIEGLENNNILAFTGQVVGGLMRMDAYQRQLLIILAEKSAGTRYAGAGEEMIGLLKEHLKAAAGKNGRSRRNQESQDYILRIIAANYIDGLLQIMKDYRSREWAEENIRTLLTYHLNGVKALMM